MVPDPNGDVNMKIGDTAVLSNYFDGNPDGLGIAPAIGTQGWLDIVSRGEKGGKATVHFSAQESAILNAPVVENNVFSSSRPCKIVAHNTVTRGGCEYTQVVVRAVATDNA